MSRLIVIDSSMASMAEIDYAAAKASGVQGVILHAGYGSELSQKDPYFDEAYRKATEAGLLTGAYWMNYFREEEDALVEAETFYQAITGCEMPLGVYSDYEEDTIDYMDRSGSSKQNMTGRLITFMNHMRDLGYANAGFYTNTSCLNDTHGAEELDRSRLAAYPLWHAHYDGNENTSEPGTAYDGIHVIGHQFANNEMKPGWIVGCNNIDVSVFEIDGNSEPAETPVAAQDDMNNEKVIYKVQSGDCLSAIAENYNVDLESLININGIADANLIYPGQELIIPVAAENQQQANEEDANSEASGEYCVQSGDTLWGISEKLYGDGASYQRLAQYNGIDDPSMIYPGQIIRY